MPNVVQVRHPLVQHHLAQLRENSTPPAEFRRLIHRLAALLAYEATQDLAVEETAIQTPLTSSTGHRLTASIGLVPILRAGLGMVDPILELIPLAEVWHLGLYRDEATAQPVQYYSKLPQTRPTDVALVLDPMLATGGSACAALAALVRWGVPRLKVLSIIAAQDGIDAVAREHPSCSIYVCAIDGQLDVRKFIVPGLGDAGDRIFNTLRGEE